MMARARYVEVTCEYCGVADYVTPGSVDSQVRDLGWIVTGARRDFCSDDCRKSWIKEQDNQINNRD
jgi:hypothetical protein